MMRETNLIFQEPENDASLSRRSIVVVVGTQFERNLRWRGFVQVMLSNRFNNTRVILLQFVSIHVIFTRNISGR